jgi:hypothetical protein
MQNYGSQKNREHGERRKIAEFLAQKRGISKESDGFLRVIYHNEKHAKKAAQF